MAQPRWQEFLTPYVERLSEWLRGGTALSTPSVRDWRSFGPAATLEVARNSVLDLHGDTFSEALEELGNAFRNIIDRSGLADVLNRVGATLQRKSVDSGPMLDVIRSRNGERTMAAVRVTPKLSTKGVDGLTGRNAATDAMLAQQALTTERYRELLTPFIESARSKTAPPFSNWEDLRFIVGTLPMGPTLGHQATGGSLVRNGELYIGAKVDTVGSNSAATLDRMRRRAGELGIVLTGRDGAPIPAGPVESSVLQAALSRHFMFDEALARGTDVLLRDGDLLNTRRIDGALSLTEIEAAMRRECQAGIDSAMREMTIAAGPKERQAASAMLDAAKRQLEQCDYRTSLEAMNSRNDRLRENKKEDREPAFNASPVGAGHGFDSGFGSDSFMDAPDKDRLGPDTVIIRMVAGEPKVYVSLPFGSSETGETERLATEISGIADLPDGVYPVETGHQIPDGYLTLSKGMVIDRQGGKQVVLPETRRPEGPETPKSGMGQENRPAQLPEAQEERGGLKMGL